NTDELPASVQYKFSASASFRLEQRLSLALFLSTRFKIFKSFEPRPAHFTPHHSDSMQTRAQMTEKRNGVVRLMAVDEDSRRRTEEANDTLGSTLDSYSKKLQ
ncbi:hypothetical protein WG66_014343, partial [Moniliophthora roreri]